MGTVADHRAALAELGDWSGYLAANSHLPGPRGNLELAAAAGDIAGLQKLVPEVTSAIGKFQAAATNTG